MPSSSRPTPRRRPVFKRKKGTVSGRLYRAVAWVSGITVLLAMAWSFHLVISKANHPRIYPADLGQVQLGRRVYAEACSGCHGLSLEGQSNWRTPQPDGKFPATPLDAAGVSWQRPDRDLFAIVKKGAAAYPAGRETDMPAFYDKLTDEEIAAALAYIKSTWPEDIQARQAQLNITIWTKRIH